MNLYYNCVVSVIRQTHPKEPCANNTIKENTATKFASRRVQRGNMFYFTQTLDVINLSLAN